MNHPAIQRSWDLSRRPVISGWRRFNTALDRVFYDTEALSETEQAQLTAYAEPEGSIVVVHPARSNKHLKFQTPLQFVRQQLGKTSEPVDAIAVAGVGSSQLGTASLARNIADYLGRPVAGIVSGLGMADVIAEAFGGWFVFGAINQMRDFVARTFDAWELPDHVRDQPSHDAMKRQLQQQHLDPEFFIYGSPDSTALLYVLTELSPRIKLLVGHSKGNYSIENALEGWQRIAEANDRTIPQHLQIVTLGAAIWFDPEFANTRQFIGGIDGLGAMNSRFDVTAVRVPGACHSLNRAMMASCLSVSQALKYAGIR